MIQHFCFASWPSKSPHRAKLLKAIRHTIFKKISEHSSVKFKMTTFLKWKMGKLESSYVILRKGFPIYDQFDQHGASHCSKVKSYKQSMSQNFWHLFIITCHRCIQNKLKIMNLNEEKKSCSSTGYWTHAHSGQA